MTTTRDNDPFELFIRHQNIAETFNPQFAMAVHSAVRAAAVDLREPDGCAYYVALLLGA